MTLRTLLFDLDGTLLPFDHEAFMKGYFQALIPRVQDYFEPAKVPQLVLQSTKEVVQNEEATLTNMDAFKKSFFGATNVDEADIWPIFEDFYQTTFDGLQHLTEPSPISREICRTAIDKGYQLVLATNPIFPDQAIRHRMRWAGIDDIPFALVTTMEDMHFCKPNPKYFMEITDLLDISPFDSMMIGNDAQEDGVAGKLGMQTFLVTDYLIDRGIGHVDFTHQGTLADVLTFVQNLPSIQS